MSETKFTPGPWYPGHMCDDNHPCNCRSIVCESYAGSICCIDINKNELGFDDNPPEIEAKANAHLIAAAPDLYEALQRLVNVSAEIAPDVQSASVFVDARAALAKARGES